MVYILSAEQVLAQACAKVVVFARTGWHKGGSPGATRSSWTSSAGSWRATPWLGRSSKVCVPIGQARLPVLVYSSDMPLRAGGTCPGLNVSGVCIEVSTRGCERPVGELLGSWS